MSEGDTSTLDVTDLPPYPSKDLTSPADAEYILSLPDKKGHEWFTLKFSTRGVSSSAQPPKVPRLGEGESLVGSVILALHENTNIKSVSIRLFGQVTLAAQDNFVFVETEQKLWGPEHGDPGSAGTVAAGHKPSKFKGKLRGQYAFPFTLALPSTVPLKHGPHDQYSIPSTFSGLRISIGYKLEAKVTRGFVTSEHELSSALMYTQRIRPGLPSPARQLAYLQGNPIPGPADDPEGWHTLAPTVMRGKIFDSEDVDLQCTLSLAKPLSYTKGTSIPVSLAIQCSNLRALDLFSSPKAPRVVLSRVVYNQYDALSPGHMIENRVYRLEGVKPATRVLFRDEVDIAGVATWWSETPSMGHAERFSDDKRVLQGEIHLRPSKASPLYPSSHLGHYKLSYHVAIFPSTGVAGFVPQDDPEVALVKCDVELATAQAEGPRPRTFSAPVDIPSSGMWLAITSAGGGGI